ncbi:MAG: methyltransferase domain-containing protein [Gammaproteobacteria bacterium]|nr:methyltransferase domain-containing protein [Gammaproteobacteria bacterium]
MTHEAEYHDNMVTMLELIWGKGYMAPGGPGNVAKLLDGTEPEGKLILDIGCGIGGPALDMVRHHSAQVVGIDLEAPLIERARSDARAAGLHEHCRFQSVGPGPLPFPNAGFDIVVSSGAITQTPDKAALFSEILRVLKPGGYFSCYEWMGTGEEQSKELRYWIELEELTYAFETLEQYGDRLRTAGFTEVSTADASDWYRREARRECALIEGELYAQMVELLGQADADHFVKDWRAMVVVCNSGEMRQGYCRGRRSS